MNRVPGGGWLVNRCPGTGLGVKAMHPSNLGPRLSRISTLWSVVIQARGEQGEEVKEARHLLLERYRPAVHRYLLGALRDPDAADELAQDFSIRLLVGKCQGADLQRGRFRDFVKGVLSHMIRDRYGGGRGIRPQPLPVGRGEPVAPNQDPAVLNQQFLESWRKELLDRALAGLEKIQHQTGRPFWTVLRFKMDHPDMHSGPMAEQLSGPFGKSVTAAGIRQILHRAREKFADLLLEEVAQTLADPTLANLEEELIDLGLYSYCQSALARRKE